MLATLALAAATLGTPQVLSFTTTRFPSEDGLKITANLYKPRQENDRPCIVLFHQARSSRGEYKMLAPRLVKLGYTCFAVDLRSGIGSGGFHNETLVAAIEAGKPFESYLESLPDMRAALRVVRERYVDEGVPVIALGSSYSASLALTVVAEDPTLADGVMAFSPGEYFTQYEKPEDWVRTAAAKIECPVFLTSAKDEVESWEPIFEAIPSTHKVAYRSERPGKHGSAALGRRSNGRDGYWEAVESFLGEHFPATPPGE